MTSKRRRGVGGGGPVDILHEGEIDPSSGASTAVHTFASQSATGPYSVLLLHWRNTSTNRTLSTVTWGAESGAILVQGTNGSATIVGVAIVIFTGAMSGDIVATFSGNTIASRATKVSLSNLLSPTAIDTAQANNSLSLSSPGEGGIRLACYSNQTSSTAVSWTNATEMSDDSAAGMRCSTAYDLGDDAGNIVSASATGVSRWNVGVALR